MEPVKQGELAMLTARARPTCASTVREKPRAPFSRRRRVNGSEVIALGGILASLFSAAAGILSLPRLVGAAGVTMLLANGLALILERTRRS